ncbi:hypothetical protein TNCV_2514771 [Trichonephila clavipes]|nr:hypothetical protein TNCV_2514771 [Trichonephila clavipes]
MPDVAPIFPALVPLATLLYIFGSEYLVPISTDKVDSEYDYIVVVNHRVLKMEVNKEKIWYILQLFFDKGENASQVAEIVNGVYSADTVTAN